MSGDATHARGYGISDTSKYTDFSIKEFPLKKAGPRDVTIAIDYCGGESSSEVVHRLFPSCMLIYLSVILIRGFHQSVVVSTPPTSCLSCYPKADHISLQATCTP